MTDTKSAPAYRSETSRGDWRILAVVLVGSFMAVLGPRSSTWRCPASPWTRTPPQTLEWVVSGCALTFGLVLVLVPAGRPVTHVMVPLLLLVPLVGGRVPGWPAWSWLLLGLLVPAAAALTWWERRLYRRHGEAVIQVGLMRHRSFWAGPCLALCTLYFAG